MKMINYLSAAGMLLFGNLLLASSANAHGATEFPVARQLYCYQQSDWGGDNTPRNEACRRLKEIGGEYPFTNWHQYSINLPEPGDLETAKALIPDGKLCSVNDERLDGVNLPSTAWPKTTIHPQNGIFQLKYSAWAPHNPSYWEIFLSKPGYSSTEPLKWSDLDLIAEFGDIPVQGPDSGQYYTLDVPIPAGRNGDALLYVRWQRFGESWFEPEGFYSCSDITIVDNGEPEFPWHEAGQFVAQDFAPKPGERVRFRLMSHERSGRELVDLYLDITDVNQDVSAWAKQLAEELNTQYANLVQIGIRSGNDIHYNDRQVYENKVFVKNQNDKPVMSIVPGGGENNPPVADAGPDATWPAEYGNFPLDGSKSHDPDGDPLTYRWEQMAGSPQLTITNPTAPATTVSLPALAQTGVFNFRLTVTDDKGASSTDTVNVTVQVGEGGEYPKYPEGIGSYVPGQTIVMGYDNNLWKCKPPTLGAHCNTSSVLYHPGHPQMEQNPQWQPWERYTGGSSHSHK